MTAAAIPKDSPETMLELYRDDGPLSRALGSTLACVIRVPPFLLVVAGVLPLVAGWMSLGDGASDPVVGAVLAWFVLLAGISSGRPHTDSLRWAVLPVLRLGEYGSVLWLASLAGGGSAAAFALLAVVAFRHYDLVYRLRYQGGPPPRWVGDLGGGWEGRLVAGYVLLLAGAFPAGLYVIACVLAVAFVGESISSWARVQRAPALAAYEDEYEDAEAGEE
jgi:Family of unknown function (DUF5941)